MEQKSPYRKSIWQQDERYEIVSVEFTKEEKLTIGRLMSVDAAKKNTPPIPVKAILELSKLAKALPYSKNVKKEDIENFLSQSLMLYGAGIPTIICILAIETNGDYSPLDRKFCSGLVNKSIISSDEETRLNGSSKRKIAKLYVEKVLPAWRCSRKSRTPEQADNYWGRGASDE